MAMIIQDMIIWVVMPCYDVLGYLTCHNPEDHNLFHGILNKRSVFL